MPGARRRRLDAELARRGLVDSRRAGREAVEAGLVTVSGAPAAKPSAMVLPTDGLVVLAPPRRWVSRGGAKLEAALDAFHVVADGVVAVDAGISTGGFTDCLLQAGAAHVVGFDVGYGQVHERLRTHPRVTVRERTNIRDVTPSLVAELLREAGRDETRAGLLVADLSFIALGLVLEVLVGLVDGPVVALVKPQFEAGREQVGRGGVVRDPAVWAAVLDQVAFAARRLGWSVADVVPSPITGPAGNVEFLVHLVDAGMPHAASHAAADGAWDELRDRVVEAGRRVADGTVT